MLFPHKQHFHQKYKAHWKSCTKLSTHFRQNNHPQYRIGLQHSLWPKENRVKNAILPYMQDKQEGLLYSKHRNVSNKSDIIHLEQCLLFLSYKMITVCPKASLQSHEAYWILWQLHRILFTKLDVRFWLSGVFSLKRVWDCRFLVKNFFSSSISSHVSWIPLCPGTHINTVSLWSTSILCNIIAWICIIPVSYTHLTLPTRRTV